MSVYPNGRLSSTTFVVEEVKIRRPVRAKGTGAEGDHDRGVGLAPRSKAGWRGLKRLDWRRWQGMRLRYSHGADPHVVVSARGREWSFTWDTAILDVLRDVANR
jgi:hypothetical protein